MKARWDLVLIPSLLVSFLFLVGSQYLFLRASFFDDLGLGRTGDEFVLTNYAQFFAGSFYLKTLWITIKVSFIATVCTLMLGYPLAYVISRMESRWVTLLIAGVVLSTFVTIVIKVFGLMIMLAADGWLNRFLLFVGIVDRPYTIFGNQVGVVIGLMHFTLGFGVLLLYSIIQTIPRELESAAQIHGASRAGVFLQIVFPLSLPGVTVGALMMFNMSMGAFTSASLLGGGRVFTLPVLVQRTVMMEVEYSMAATIAAVLLVSTLLINLLSVYLMRRSRMARLVIT